MTFSLGRRSQFAATSWRHGNLNLRRFRAINESVMLLKSQRCLTAAANQVTKNYATFGDVSAASSEIPFLAEVIITAAPNGQIALLLRSDSPSEWFGPFGFSASVVSTDAIWRQAESIHLSHQQGALSAIGLVTVARWQHANRTL